MMVNCLPDMEEMRMNILVAALALAACGTCAKPQEQAEVPDPERCSELLEQIRALRDGPQPCESQDECTVWHNGAYWDGCPPEVNAGNAARLDELRGTFEQEGCVAVTERLCPPRRVRGCVLGTCGADPPFKHKLNPEQQKVYDEKVEEADREAAEKARKDEPVDP
jgi:hypothetical protein